jgi:SAM-dependent methyltransferase
MPQFPPGLLKDGSTYNIDLQAIAFPDKQFDIILSSDVMEHVRDLTAANMEILRCLKPGGVHIFTIPFDEQTTATRTLIDTSSSKDIYLEPPQVHGDSITGGIVAYRVYARDLLDTLRSVGFEANMFSVKARQNGIFEGRYFSARRPK